MRALVYRAPGVIALEEAEEPRPGPEEAVVSVAAVGICGSDMHAYHGHDARRPAPLILGHEAAGVVETGRLAGRSVTVNPLVTCGVCDACVSGRDNLCQHRQIISMPPREGAFAERLAMPERNLVEVPEGVPLAHAALAEPLACGWHALRLASGVLSGPLMGCQVAVLGGGAIGVGAALIAAAQGARPVIVETNPLRRPVLERLGLGDVVDAAETEDWSATADLVIDAHGSPPTRAAASRLVRPGGVILHIGLSGGGDGLDMRRITLQEITVIGTYTYTQADFRATAQAIFERRLGDFSWVEERALSDGPTAFGELAAGRVAASKIVLVP